MIGFLLGPWGKVAVAAAIVAGVWFYGQHKYSRGVADTTAAFIEADQKGAENVRETAAKALRDLAGLGADDLDERLRANGGLREDTE